MYERKMAEELDCGIRAAMKVFGGKWKLCIIDAISTGVSRPVEIHKSIPNATLRVIEMQLAELLFFGVVEKHTEDSYPKKSEYKLTEFGESILPLLLKIDKWGTENSEFIKERLDELQDTE